MSNVSREKNLAESTTSQPKGQRKVFSFAKTISDLNVNKLATLNLKILAVQGHDIAIAETSKAIEFLP